ncbi:hypothetical protein ACFYRY_35260 [Streptomyces sp. NPDC005263]
MQGSPTPMEFFEEMRGLHPERINPSTLWFGALSLLGAEPTP